MGFYNNSTEAFRRITELTGDINISNDFKKEISARGIPIYKGYSIQKRLLFEAEEEKLLSPIDVDKRIMELLEENSKNKVSTNYVDKCSSCEGATKIPPMPNESATSLPTSGSDLDKHKDLNDRELLEKVSLQNQKIINQNKIIIQELRKLNEKVGE
ncbi:MAG: hypothetical protein HUK28_00220 [Methanobrevibacter sp.]|nr:hypothetical protein [Methanobrevibacter sp.]